MAGFSAQGATFTFSPGGRAPFTATVTGISIETPVAEVVDMTSGADAVGTLRIVPTGEWVGGSVSVDFVATQAFLDPHSQVRQRGRLSFLSPSYSYVANVILESATTEARTGEIVRGTMRFKLTDYYGS